MKKEFVSYEQALALKELGFDDDCYGYFKGNSLVYYIPEIFSVKNSNVMDTAKNKSLDYDTDDYIAAPLKQQALRWFRGKHYRFSIYWDWETDSYMFDVFGPIEPKHGKHQFIFESEYEYDTHRAAEDACIDKLIDIIKNK